MKNITRDNLTDTVKSSFAQIDDERLRHLVNRLTHHLHAFAHETQLTHEEWREGIAFLHRAAEISSPSRSEFTLMSDVLGLSSLVDLLAPAPVPPKAACWDLFTPGVRPGWTAAAA